MAIVLQYSHGSSTTELEHLLLEYQARESDLRLSIKDLIGAVDGVAEMNSHFEKEGDPSPFGATMQVKNGSASPGSLRRASIRRASIQHRKLVSITPALYAKADGFNKVHGSSDATTTIRFRSNDVHWPAIKSARGTP